MNKKLLSKEERFELKILLKQYWDSKGLVTTAYRLVRLYRFQKSQFMEGASDSLYKDSIIYAFCKSKVKEFYDRLKEENPLRFKIYKQRGFPSALRNYIFNRDNFTCKVCLKNKNQLSENIFLEVDHIVSWEDGGETTLSNGQTICSDCNKGKHHAKKHLKLAV